MPSAPPGGFAALVCELLAPLGDVRARRMFGGYGIYRDGVMFALITGEDLLYLRTDDENRPAYEQAGLPAFRPFPDKPMRMPYHRPPDSVLDDGEEMLAWAGPALTAALRAQAAKPKKRR
ncbi:TfoX/Sxy family protein [Azospirillum halopraeferens]|uniref:TfoX/Sxy family protein n=1 Tax=Azospirillum halopraeferens TaxID=34010 RepID=UPI0004123D39|nr:TfoX/Sxy family protein [Azospirillum halopraeferens]